MHTITLTSIEDQRVSKAHVMLINAYSLCAIADKELKKQSVSQALLTEFVHHINGDHYDY
jgi:hypothetical protein